MVEVGKPVVHDSAQKHLTGEAVFIDDMVEPNGLLHVCLGYSQKAHAKITKLDLDPVRNMAGVVLVLAAGDIPGRNDASHGAGDETLFAGELVEYVGQPLFAVAAESRAQAASAVEAAIVGYDELPAILDIDQARAAQSDIEPPQVMAFGDSGAALEKSTHRLRGQLTTGGQDHFYLEGQVALAVPQEDGDVLIHSSTQSPTDVQHVVSRILGVPYNAVTVEVRRIGGAFGGKESQSGSFAAVAALVATKTGRAAKLRLDRDADMIITGKRHDFQISYDVGFDEGGAD